jgi:hypothetical protein
MKAFYFSAAALIGSWGLWGGVFSPIQTPQEIQEELSFLTSSTEQTGFTYQGTAGQLNGLMLPLSYYSTPDYWGSYVGGLPGNDLTVVDVFNPSDYTLTPSSGSPGGGLQVERVNVFYGTDIYDAACWQLALAVCAHAGMTGPGGQSLYALAQGQDLLLQLGYDGNASQTTAGANRATTHADGTFTYNGAVITTAPNAYFFRMITRNWLSVDPFMGTSYMRYVTAQGLPQNPDYQAGKITWMDWKPITGENAWALFIGPLQTARLKQQSDGAQFVPYAAPAVQNAVQALVGLSCMQSALGGIYYACKGSLGNQGDQPVDPYSVSVENNASALAGLMVLKQVLQDELQYETDLTQDQRSQIQNTLQQIQTMVQGGAHTEGLLAFFQKYAWDAQDGVFYQGGDANNPKLGVDWSPTTEPKAVDVTTWGLSVLGQPLVDQWFGFGAAYRAWQNVKSWGGFFGPDGQIWGVGFSDQDGNGSGGDYNKGIISAEWSAGAINMLRCLITQYGAAAVSSAYSPAEQQQAQGYAADLQKDHDSLCGHFLTLRSDNYPAQAAYAAVRPAGYQNLIPIPQGKLSFVYASKRYAIPFGWFANPIPSTTSTSWAVMLDHSFNPFRVGGGYDAPQFTSPSHLMSLAVAPRAKPEDADLARGAEQLAALWQDGFQWSDLGAMIGLSVRFLNGFLEMSDADKRAAIIQMIERMIDQTDTPYLPDAYTDPLFKAMVPPFVDLFLPASAQPPLSRQPLAPLTAEAVRATGSEIIASFQDGFQWADLGNAVQGIVRLARAYERLSSQERKTFAKQVIDDVIDHTDTPYLPDSFTDPIFKQLAYGVIEQLL